jgi:hypothetical protein
MPNPIGWLLRLQVSETPLSLDTGNQVIFNSGLMCFPSFPHAV